MDITKQLAAIQRRLDKTAIEQLRDEVARLHEELEVTHVQLVKAQDELYRTESELEWREREHHEMVRAFNESDYATHRFVGLSRSGHCVVVER